MPMLGSSATVLTTAANFSVSYDGVAVMSRGLLGVAYDGSSSFSLSSVYCSKSGNTTPCWLATSAIMEVSPPESDIDENVACLGSTCSVESSMDIAISSSRSSTRMAPNFFSTASNDLSEPVRLPVWDAAMAWLFALRPTLSSTTGFCFFAAFFSISTNLPGFLTPSM